MQDSSKTYFPILIDLKQHKALIIGGGKVAYRKANNLLKFGCKEITVISPEYCEEFKSFFKDEKFTFFNRKYESGDVDNFTLVFAATADQKADDLIKEECDKKSILVNVADVPTHCNFIMPATVKRGDFILAISSQGSAPFLVSRKRRELSKIITPIFSDLTALAKEFRNLILADDTLNEDDRKELFDKFLAEDWEEILYLEGVPAARRKMLALINI